MLLKMTYSYKEYCGNTMVQYNMVFNDFQIHIQWYLHDSKKYQQFT